MLSERPQIGVLPLIAEIVNHCKSLTVESPFDSEQRVVTCFEAAHISPGREYHMIPTNVFKPLKPLKQPALAGVLVVTQLSLIPGESASVQITAVVCLQRIVVIAVVVDLTYLISGVQDRNAALRQKPGMQHQIPLNGKIERGGITIGRLYT